MSVSTNINAALRRVFRQYETEKERELSEWRKQQLAVEERHLVNLQMRDIEAENRVDKRLVHARNQRKAGVFAVRDKGSVEEKLRKAYGGKVAQRILKAERLAARERPDEVRVYLAADRQQLVRGVDFVVVPRPHGEPTLVLHDNAKVFEVEYAESFPYSLA